MRISIITVCKNAAKDIEKAIKSVANQTYDDLEYIVVDGDSQDGTKEIVNRYSDKISRFISEPDNGLYQAMNKGIRYSSGEFIGFLNADDYLVDNLVIGDAVRFLSKHPSCDFLYGDLEVRYSSKKSVIVKPPRPEDALDTLVCGCLPHQASLSRAELFFEKIGFFTENYRISADYEWFLRLLQDETVKLCYYPRTFTSYYVGGLSSQIRLSLPESYSIQNRFPLYQEDYWLKRRILKYQEFVINLREWLANAETSRDVLEEKYEALQKDYQSLASQYHKVKDELEQMREAIAQPSNPHQPSTEMETESLQPVDFS
ncbi:MAG TPA: glycosyltransferase [Crinalium sp.]